jgi:murein L,D-transpeptidase YafK
VSYPNKADQAAARRAGVDPGGDIFVHGITNGLGWLGRLHRLVDWTAGCIAVTDRDIEEIWQMVPDGTPIEIRP